MGLTVSPGQAGRLTPRQAQILKLMANGLTPRQIAECLGVRYYTVATHTKQIFRKLAVHHRAEAVAVAFQHGLVEPLRSSAVPVFCPCCGRRPQGRFKPGVAPAGLRELFSRTTHDVH